MSTKDGLELFDIIFLSPGLEAKIKLDSRITGRTALLVAMALEQAMTVEGQVKRLLSPEDQEAMKGLVGEVLAKGKLGPLYERLKRMG
jgi:hypothetical protein